MAWTDITNAEVAAGAPVTTALMTALRDNVTALAERASGAPKILGNPYNTQVFAASGTWTKPSNAESGDIVVVWGVGAGASGAIDTVSSEAGGGGGGIGFMWRIDDIDDLSATESVTIGSGAGTNVSANGSNGGNTIFGTSGNPGYCRFTGGVAGKQNGNTSQNTVLAYNATSGTNVEYAWQESEGGGETPSTSSVLPMGSHFGGGGGGSSRNLGAFSAVGGHGGRGNASTAGVAGSFPGGGGGGSRDSTGGAGADGYMIVYCIKEI